MSSRSLAAARARRSGENAPPVSGNRPGTSIGSQAAFANQQAYQQPNNVRVSSRQPAPGQQQQQQYQPQQQQYQQQQQQQYQQQQYQQQQQQEQPQNKLGFNKISISDAIGLVTLRLGRVEKYIIETQHEKELSDNLEQSNLPENSKVIDTSLLNNIVNRLDSLEKKEAVPEDITKLTEQLTRISNESNKHTLAISKHTEQLFRFERELVETKDILKTFMIKYDNFAKETTDRFSDFEFALSEVEKNIPVSIENQDIQEREEDEGEEDEDEEEGEEGEGETNEFSELETNSMISNDLKNLIKQEFSVIS